MATPLTTIIDPRLSRITLNRPEKMNAFSRDMLEAFDAALMQVVDGASAMLVVEGSGGNFCAGADLDAVRGVKSEAERREFQALFQRIVRRLSELPCWTVAKIEGVAFAGGFELLLACDEAITAPNARIGDMHMRYSLIPGAGGTVLLPQVLGVRAAKRFIACAETATAEQAVAMGLVTAVVDPADMPAWIEKRADYFVTRSAGVARIKSLMHAANASSTGEERWRREFEAICEHLSSPQALQGLAQFADRSRPARASS